VALGFLQFPAIIDEPLANPTPCSEIAWSLQFAPVSRLTCKVPATLTLTGRILLESLFGSTQGLAEKR